MNERIVEFNFKAAQIEELADCVRIFFIRIEVIVNELNLFLLGLSQEMHSKRMARFSIIAHLLSFCFHFLLYKNSPNKPFSISLAWAMIPRPLAVSLSSQSTEPTCTSSWSLLPRNCPISKPWPTRSRMFPLSFTT